MTIDSKRTKRHLPHVEEAGKYYFITFVSKERRKFEPHERSMIFDLILSEDGILYDLIQICIMPDHAHLIMTPKRNHTLSFILQKIKGVTARKINISRGELGSVWQDESFDKLINSDTQYYALIDYVRENPVKANFVKRGDNYPWLYCKENYRPT